VCEPGTPRPGRSADTTDELFRVIDLRTATIVSEQSAVHTERVDLAAGDEGAGPQGDLGSGAWGELFTYWRNATDIGSGQATAAVRSNDKLHVLGAYSISYTIHVWKMTCVRQEVCNASGTGWVTRRQSLMMSPQPDEQGETARVTVNLEHPDAGRVTGAVLAAIRRLVKDLSDANRQAEDAAKRFEQYCGRRST
jgi:hypothetical protein